MNATTGKRSALPPMTDVAADLRDGADLDDLALAFGISTRQLRYRLNEAGWSQRGLPLVETERRETLPTFTRGDTTWMDEAVCASVDPALFFPPSGVVPSKALAICESCPVRQTCLDYAIDNGFDDGLFGGVVRKKRIEMRRAKEAGREYAPPARKLKATCARGHAFTEENTYLDKRGARICRACRRAGEVRRKPRNRNRGKDTAA